MKKIAFLGLGAMGSRMVGHLIAAGHDVQIWNRTTAATLAIDGASVAGTPREAANGADAVFVMVSDDLASRSVWKGADGALAGLRPGATAIEVTTASPEWIAELSAAVGVRGARLVDAPVVGSLPQAEAAQLVALVGGEDEAVNWATPLIKQYANTVFHAGASGRGCLMKLIANALLAAQVAGLAEALGFAAAQGISMDSAMDMIAGLPVASAAGIGMGRLMAAGDTTPRFTAALMAKDLRYAAVAAASSETPMPITDAVLKVYQSLVDAGQGSLNVTAPILRYRR
ncbi:2-hydroxy-3-oxopropionate reductase [Hartmannibacter diazotrophicus]|uniref:2-hydroxy-3-oxopropionate reductase n=1 Tax=Hartmannibacter diazotrophicus TaxID=1482074 RepID=A0A2C9D0X0_9HYPH|nr:NAD(P)-dependent oxidoreductase [Hartmannibacter diazotrophicus]SON54027.1 2-hydroxy-3-oxopropionate reductase [Hartmannibacter diazotrophicus]